MSSLYTLTNDFIKVLNMLNDEDADEEMIKDTLESIDLDIEEKADNYAKIIKDLESKRDARKLEAKRLTDSARTLDNRITFLKQNLFYSMKAINKTKFTTDLFSFNIAKNGGKRTLTIDGEVPEEYIRIVKEEDKDKIREALENGIELTFAHLEEQGESLRIK